ncbi:unnamed protein product [Paramecium pentaurelia]|uniref:Uncharacterized protein n=1 Tax=Paramecium pentaurelia TaxID=43138 RepID=A0A8S1TGP9_9CILI|nr:unnamed protein product [Paramecium pentaurelia]
MTSTQLQKYSLMDILMIFFQKDKLIFKYSKHRQSIYSQEKIINRPKRKIIFCNKLKPKNQLILPEKKKGIFLINLLKPIQIDDTEESKQLGISQQESNIDPYIDLNRYCNLCKVVFKSKTRLKQQITKKHHSNLQQKKIIIFVESIQVSQICAADHNYKSTKTKTSICLQTIKLQTPNQLIVLTWNVSSMKYDTLKTVKQTGAHIMCFQETRKEILNFPSFTYYNRLGKENHTRGGGIAIGVHNQFFTKDISNILPQIDKQLEMVTDLNNLIKTRNIRIEYLLTKKTIFLKIKSHFYCHLSIENLIAVNKRSSAINLACFQQNYIIKSNKKENRLPTNQRGFQSQEHF